MCRQCVTPESTCPGCSWKCVCNYACYRCQMGYLVDCGHGYISFPYLDEYRRKYVCFACHLVWKSALTKYDDVAYSEKQPSCRKCGAEGIRVGPTFVACKTDKEWNALKEQVDKGEIDMYTDFHFCPTTRGPFTPSEERRYPGKPKPKLIYRNRGALPVEAQVHVDFS